MRFAAVIAVLLALLAGTALAATTAATAPVGGTIQVWATPSPGDSPYGKVVVTGAIGDFGKATVTNKNGKVNTNGEYVRFNLSQGSFVIDQTALRARFGHLKPKINTASCTVIFKASNVPVVVSQGTGTYANISGKGKLTYLFAGVSTRYATGAKKGQCNLSDNAPERAGYSSVTGAITVKFS